MRKIASLMLALLMLALPLASCEEKQPEATEAPTTEANNATEAPTEELTQTGGKDMLNGKKVIFIGNSHLYYGRTVIDMTTSVLSQSMRSADRGMFYQLCKLNELDVTVTNWAFGSHNLTDTFRLCETTQSCKGEKHQDRLTDRYYDYVVISEGSSASKPAEFLANVDMVIDFFKTANPNVKFIFMLHARALDGSPYAWISAVKELESRGVTVAPVGSLVCDVMNGKTAVPGATLTYNKNSFIVARTSSDGYHPNLLTGYLTALFVYCAITGESAVGQPYSFAIDKNVNSKFDYMNFITSYYKVGSTNFHQILQSEADMKGLQQLVDQCLAEKPYRQY